MFLFSQRNHCGFAVDALKILLIRKIIKTNNFFYFFLIFYNNNLLLLVFYIIDVFFIGNQN